jgi:hypothetical protein
MLYISLFKCSLYYILPSNTHIFYYKTLGNVTFEIFTTSMKYQRCVTRNQPDELKHCYHDVHSIQFGQPVSHSVFLIWTLVPARGSQGFLLQNRGSEFCVPKIRAELAPSAGHDCWTVQPVFLDCSPILTGL